jgi:hypothetical protein
MRTSYNDCYNLLCTVGYNGRHSKEGQWCPKTLRSPGSAWWPALPT